MRISTYKDSLIFGLTQVTNYRSEVWLMVLNKAIYLGGIIFLWSLIGKSASVGVNSLVSYFLIANSVQGLVDAESLRFTRTLNEEIKTGTLSAHLLRPINPVIFLYTSFLGTRGVIILMAILLAVTGFLFLPSFSIIQFILFLISVFLAFIISFIFNLLVGSLTFWSPEANHLQNVASHFIRVFSGVLIPITFFPDKIKQILLLTPLPSVAYLPSIIMQTHSLNKDILTSFLSTIFWIGILLPFSFFVWRSGLKRYEAVGI